MRRLVVVASVLALSLCLAGTSRGIPDPPAPDQVPWGLDRIDQRSNAFDNRFQPGGTGLGVRIYVIDTGVKLDHSDFLTAGAEPRRALAGGTWTQDGRGANDCGGHGTHVAGIAAGSRYGVAKRATVISVRIGDCNGFGRISYDYLDDAVRWVTAQHAGSGVTGVVNISSTPQLTDDFRNAVRDSLNAGLVYTVAAGEENTYECEANQWSTFDSRVIIVGASTPSDQRQFDSNSGPCVELYAPGEEVVSDWPFPADWSRPCTSSTKSSEIDGETWCNGTSMAAPHVAGAAALYLERYPEATPAQVEWALRKMATKGVIADRVTPTSRGDLLYARMDAAPPAPPDPHCGIVCH